MTTIFSTPQKVWRYWWRADCMSTSSIFSESTTEMPSLVDITVMYMAVTRSNISSISGRRKKIWGMSIDITMAGTIRHALRSVVLLSNTSSQLASVFSAIFTVIGTNIW